MNPIKVISVFGTRPEAIKMAPLVLELRRRADFESLVCVTAQHRQMLDDVCSHFELVPDFDLNIMRDNQSLEDITTRILGSFGELLTAQKPDLVLVHGDTTTTFASALAAFYKKIPVGHVEAGLRTGDRYSPFPEEMNRTLVSRLAAYHFAPTAGNAKNLADEGVLKNVFITGNTVIDAMSYTVGDGCLPPALDALAPAGKKLVLLTCHRRENYGANMENIFAAVLRLARENPEIEIVYPVHPAPYVFETAHRLLDGHRNIHLLEPLDAVSLHRLMSRCNFVMTDSGGLQEEAPALGKPVVVLRRETERPEAIAAGTVILAGTQEETVFAAAYKLLHEPEFYNRMARAVNPYGDGRASCRIAEAILFAFNRRAKKPEDYSP